MALHAAIILLSRLIHEGEQRHKPYIVGDPRMVIWWVASVTPPLKNPGYAHAKHFFNNVIACTARTHCKNRDVTTVAVHSHAKTPLSKSEHTVSYFMIGFLPRLSNKHFLILIEWLSSRTGIWRRGTNDQISGDFHACLIALRARSAHAFKKSLDFATFIRNQPLIPEMTFFCIHIKLSYDSRDDVVCTHKISLWFHWWCYVHT